MQPQAIYYIYIYIYINIYIYLRISYKFKRAFFRHDRRTVPKFGMHVRIETRLAHQKKLTNPTPEGFRGLFIDVCGMWDVCGMFVGCLWDLWDVCGMIQAGGR